MIIILMINRLYLNLPSPSSLSSELNKFMIIVYATNNELKKMIKTNYAYISHFYILISN